MPRTRTTFVSLFPEFEPEFPKILQRILMCVKCNSLTWKRWNWRTPRERLLITVVWIMIIETIFLISIEHQSFIVKMLLEKIVSVGTNASNKEKERETKLQHKNDSPPRVFSARERKGGCGRGWIRR